MTIRDLLQLDSLKGSCVVTNSGSEDVIITGVNVMEVPDIINWVKSGEFLLTAGYSYRNKPDEFAGLIPQLAKKGIAAIGIKSHRYFDRIPEKIIENGNKCGLIIIEIAADVVFSNVSREVIQSLMATEYMQMSSMLDKITTLSNIILNGSGLLDFINKLYEYIGNPILLMKDNGECISIGLKNEDAYTTDGNEGLAGSDMEDRQGVTTMKVGVKSYKAYFYSVGLVNSQMARMYIIEKNKETNNSDIHLIEQCSFMIGMELQSENIRTNIELKYIDQFLQSWIMGKIESESSFFTQSDTCKVKIDKNNQYCVGIVHLKGAKSQVIRFRKNLRMYSSLYVTGINEEIITIFPKSMEEMYTSRILEIAENIDKSARLCIGKASKEYYNLSDSYKDADNILKVSTKYNLLGKILHYKDMGVYSLLYLIPMGKELDEYMSLYMKPLLEYDKKHQTNMYDTLKVYLDTKGNVKATAEALFMHYNTISYRLDRISHILNMDIANHEIQFSLNMAIKMNDMYLQNN